MTADERKIARGLAERMFADRKGHGGGPLTYRKMTRHDLEAFALVTIRLTRMAEAEKNGARAANEKEETR